MLICLLLINVLQLKDLTVQELKYYLSAHGLPLTGKKETLISRILTHMGKWASMQLLCFVIPCCNLSILHYKDKNIVWISCGDNTIQLSQSLWSFPTIFPAKSAHQKFSFPGLLPNSELESILLYRKVKIVSSLWLTDCVKQKKVSQKINFSGNIEASGNVHSIQWWQTNVVWLYKYALIRAILHKT